MCGGEEVGRWARSEEEKEEGRLGGERRSKENGRREGGRERDREGGRKQEALLAKLLRATMMFYMHA